MSRPYFYSHTTRNVLVAFMSLFNKIQVKRYDDEGNESKTIDVPIKFGPMSKYYMRRKEDGSLKRYYVQYPALAVTINDFIHNPERAVSAKETRQMIDPDKYDNPMDFLTDMMPAPWDLGFTLHIKTESFQDFTQIVEQIIPFFNPSVNLRVKEFNTIDLERNIRVLLTGLTPEFTEDIEEESQRYISGQMTFTADAWFYRPIYDGKIIRKIISKYGFDPRHDMFEYYNTSAVPSSAMSDYTTSGSVTSGDLHTLEGLDYKYINEAKE